MKKKSTYKTDRVEQVRVSELLPMLVAGCIVALDVAKAKFVVALATWSGEIVKLFRFEHPTETRAFLAVFEELRRGVDATKLRVAMEPTGTYGDAVRHRLHDAGAEIHMVSPKKTHDACEIFDSVPSMHDPKAAVVIAKVCALGLSARWQPAPQGVLRMRALVDTRSHILEHHERCIGRLEARLARHWPEFMRWLDLRHQKTAAPFLKEFPGPARVAADPQRVREFLRVESRSRLSPELIAGVIADAGATLGVPMLDEEASLVAVLASQVHSANADMELVEREIGAVGEEDELFVRLAPLVGTYTAAAILTHCDPRRSKSARQFEKACGLNLREKSSGEHQGRLSITKRGPGLVRQVIYLFALRMIASSPIVEAWYVRRSGYTKTSKARAVVAVMRKLVRALFHVAGGATFDASKLFDVRRLKLDDASASTEAKPRRAKIQPRTTPHSIAGVRKRGRADGAQTSA